MLIGLGASKVGEHLHTHGDTRLERDQFRVPSMVPMTKWPYGAHAVIRQEVQPLEHGQEMSSPWYG